MHCNRHFRRVLLAATLASAAAAAPERLPAGPVGAGDLGHVLILDEKKDADDEIDVFDVHDATFQDAILKVPVTIRRADLVGTETELRFLVPADGSLGSSWTATNFDDTSWPRGENGIGYDHTTAGAPAAPLAYWPLNGDATDASGNGHDGLAAGGASYRTDTPESLASTASIELDGASAAITVPGFTGVSGAAPRTLSAWIKPASSDGPILSWGKNSAGEKWTFRVHPDASKGGVIRVEVNNGYIAGNTAVDDGRWHHVAAVFPGDATPDATDVRLYVDGILDAEYLAEPVPTTSLSEPVHTASQDDVTIGTDVLDRYFEGFIDDVAIWDRALTPRQIGELAGGKPPTDLRDEREIGGHVRTDIASSMAGANASVYLRIPFEVEFPGDIPLFILRVQYDDGFVAYLNGEEIARRGAPAAPEPPAWNATAAAQRPDESAAFDEAFELAGADLPLRSGTNVLALHGLNASADAPAFLLSAELVADRSARTLDSITESETAGTAYALAQEGSLYEIDWLHGSVREIDDLSRSLPPGATHRNYDSITRLVGSPLLYILRTDRGGSSAAATDFIDTYDPRPGVQERVALAVFQSSGTGTISISEGPPFPPYGDRPALYTIATGGSFEVFDPARAASPPTVISTGRPAGTAGNLVSLTWLPGDEEHLYILQDHTGGGDADKDHIHVYDLDGNVDVSAYQVDHTGASSLTESPRSGFLYSQASGGSVAHVEVAAGQAGVTDLVSGVSTDAQGAAPLSLPTPFGEYIFIADDDTANHLDAYDTRFTWKAGCVENVLEVPPTPPGPGGGTDWADSSLTDAGGLLWQLHTDGVLVQIDPESGDPFVVADFDPPPQSSDRSTYESITNVPGDPRLFMLRTDRPLTAKKGGGLTDRIDVFDTESMEFVADAYTTVGTGVISISDGPPFNSGKVSTGDRPAVYLIATGGSFEVLDPDGSGVTLQIRSGLAGADGDGSMISITNLPRDPDHLYVLRDRSGGGGKDRIDVLDLDGGANFDAVALSGTGAKSITDTNSGLLYTNATGGSSNLVDIDISSPEDSIVHSFTCPEATNRCSATNVDSGTPPGGAVFFRGDADGSGSLQLTDAVFVLNWLFLSGDDPACLDAADADDNGKINITDAILVLQHLFLGGPEPAPPGPPGRGNRCGLDPSESLGCQVYEGC